MESMGGGVQGACAFPRAPWGLNTDTLACPGLAPSIPCSPQREGLVGGREAGSLGFPRRGGKPLFHRSMLSSVGLEKQVCSSFSQNSSSSWIGSQVGALSASPCLWHTLHLETPWNGSSSLPAAHARSLPGFPDLCSDP